MHDFMFNWMMTEKKKLSSHGMDLASSGGRSRSKPAHGGLGSLSGPLSGPLSVTKLNDVLGMLTSLENELCNVREDVVALHNRVDSYSQEGTSAPKFAPPGLPNIQPTEPNEEEQPEQGEDPPVLLPGSVQDES